MNTDLSLIREKGFRLLTERLGAVDTVQFIRQFEAGAEGGDYTEERRETLRGISIDDIAASVAARKGRVKP
jgi:hypothetical protein